METRANYVLIGAFTLAAIAAALGFFIWLAQFQVDRQYDRYDILFDNVSGLNRAADVRFNGLSVGQVLELGLNPENPNQVRVTIEVVAETPIRTDTTARLQMQGVTGVGYVALTGGTPGSPLLRSTTGEVPVIQGSRSIVEALTQDAPDLLTEAIGLLRSLQRFVSPTNQDYVTGILSNLNDASGQIQTALTDFSSISRTLADAGGKIGDFTTRLDEIGASVETALTTGEETLRVARDAFAQADTTLATATGTFESAKGTFDGAQTIMRDDVPKIIADLSTAAATLRTAVDDLSGDARTVLSQFGSAAVTADARLLQLQATIRNLDTTLSATGTTMAAVESASTSFETLMEGDGAALVAEARAAFAKADSSIAALDRVVQEDVPAIVAEVRSAVDTANRVIEQVGADVTGFTGSLRPLTATADTALKSATTTFEDASVTLARLDSAMDTAERTLTAAEATFTTANRIIDQEVAPTAADIRTAAERLSAAAIGVSADLPAVTAQLLATIEKAGAVVDQVDAAVAASAPQVESFATTGLPQFTRLAAEARRLVTTLERISARLERDPARFLFGNQAPDYRR